MDPTNDLGRGAADTASQTATNMTASLPSVLQDLKGSLNQIFAKDNPLVQQRGTELTNYLSAGDQARADYLPTHSGFAFSPTELNAMVSARQAAALGPLAGTNQMLSSMYGGLTDYLSNAKDLFAAKVAAAQANANRLQQIYNDNRAAAAAAAGSNDIVDIGGSKYLVNKVTGEKKYLGPATSGSGTDLSALANLFGNQNNNAAQVYGPWQPTEAQPSSNSTTKSQNLPSTSYVPNLNNEPNIFQSIGKWLFPSGNVQPITNQPLNISGPLNINPNSTGYGGY